MIKQVLNICRKYNQAQKDERSKIETNYNQDEDKYAKLFLYPSHKLDAEERAKIHKEVIKYIMATRSDLIWHRYNKGGMQKDVTWLLQRNMGKL